jgi:hypothetical protein
VERAWEHRIEARNEFVAEILVEEELHAAEPDARRRSRAAAKANAART